MDKPFKIMVIEKILLSKTLLCVIVLVSIFKIGLSALYINFPQNVFFADITKSSLEIMVNKTRQALGINKLAQNPQLEQAAQLKAQNMIQDQYFSHTSPSGVSPWHWFLKSGYSYKYAGENLAVGFYDSKEVFDAWLNSPTHKENIINPNYTEVGTAVISGFGPSNAIIVVQEFGSPLSESRSVLIQTDTSQSDNNIDPAESYLSTEESSSGATSKVLSQSIESQDFLQTSAGNADNALSSLVMNYILYNHQKILYYLVYSILVLVAGGSFALVLSNPNHEFGKRLAMRIVLFVVILSVAILFDSKLIISLIPHQVII